MRGAVSDDRPYRDLQIPLQIFLEAKPFEMKTSPESGPYSESWLTGGKKLAISVLAPLLLQPHFGYLLT